MSHKIAEPLIGATPNSFAYKTIKERWPKIVTKVIDELHRSYHPTVNAHGQEYGDDINSIIAKISETRYRMETNKPLLDFEGKTEDEKQWNIHLNKMREMAGEEKATWYDLPWLFVECYLYAKLHEYCTSTKHMKDYDLFKAEKTKAFFDSQTQIHALAVELIDWEKDKNVDEKMVLTRLLQIDLWGNKCDLSLSCGDAHAQIHDMFQKLDEFSPMILSNDIEAAVEHIMTKCNDKDFHIVLDNAGLEVFTDFALAEFIINRKLAKRVIFHGKDYPWFVSDVTEGDYNWVLNSLENDEKEQRWKNRPEFIFKHEPFWTTGYSFWDINDKDPKLFNELKSAGLVLLKGDLCYRKLVGDRSWPINTPFKFALQSCTFPLIVLRTLKAETVAGLSDKAIKKVQEKYGKDDLTWMVTSDYAVAQLNISET
uniref:Sugar phosphate phosphatase n=1 Tax=Panagrolaimus sp. ES5 TaxID=591445 RepID=A0AC34FVD5_9BILA